MMPGQLPDAAFNTVPAIVPAGSSGDFFCAVIAAALVDSAVKARNIDQVGQMLILDLGFCVF
jgi:hypothetical protein